MPNINTNPLALRRTRLGYEQKQIAGLLGHKTIYQICRYENEQRIPNFKDAVKLSIIYRLSLEVLFKHFFHKWDEELQHRLTVSNLSDKIKLETAQNLEFCSYLEIMKKSHINRQDAGHIRHHIKVLVEERTKKILKN